MAFIDYYKTLGINSKAPPVEIRKAFRLLAKKYHPDKNFGSSSAQEKFIQVHEAYEVLSDSKRREAFDYTYTTYYSSTQKTAPKPEPKQEKEKEIFRPSDLRDRVIKMRSYVRQTNFDDISRSRLYAYLLELVSDNNVKWLLFNKDPEINKSIIENILPVLKFIPFDDSKILRHRLTELAEKDVSILNKIESSFRRGKVISAVYKRRIEILVVFLVAIFSTVTYWEQSGNHKNISPEPVIYNVYHDSSSSPAPAVYKRDSLLLDKSGNIYLSSKKKVEDYSDWDDGSYSTGNTPGCYSFRPKYDFSLENRLEISVGKNANVAIKLINSHTNKCIRYVYISAGENYTMRNIPQGKYYVKIAYGSAWKEKYSNGKCRAKFTINNIYKRGAEIFDYNKIPTGTKFIDGKEYETYDLPSFQLSLDVVTTDDSDKFRTDEIEENDFDN